MRLICSLNSSRHAFLMSYIYCSQFAEPKRIIFLVDTGCTTTTIAPNDVHRLEINYDVLEESTPSQTVDRVVIPRILMDVDLFFAGRKGFLNMQRTILKFHLAQIDVIYPSPREDDEQEHPPPLARSVSMLGMDVLKHFRKWHFKNHELLLDS